MTTPSTQERPFSSISIQGNTLRENYVPFDGSSLSKWQEPQYVCEPHCSAIRNCQDGRAEIALLRHGANEGSAAAAAAGEAGAGSTGSAAALTPRRGSLTASRGCESRLSPAFDCPNLPGSKQQCRRRLGNCNAVPTDADGAEVVVRIAQRKVAARQPAQSNVEAVAPGTGTRESVRRPGARSRSRVINAAESVEQFYLGVLAGRREQRMNGELEGLVGLKV